MPPAHSSSKAAVMELRMQLADPPQVSPGTDRWPRLVRLNCSSSRQTVHHPGEIVPHQQHLGHPDGIDAVATNAPIDLESPTWTVATPPTPRLPPASARRVHPDPANALPGGGVVVVGGAR